MSGILPPVRCDHGFVCDQELRGDGYFYELAPVECVRCPTGLLVSVWRRPNEEQQLEVERRVWAGVWSIEEGEWSRGEK